MVKGSILKDCDESIVSILMINLSQIMDTFCEYAQIKDIRLIKDKDGDFYRDFAFIEFHSVEDATFVLERAK